jgi:hypothetical protein
LDICSVGMPVPAVGDPAIEPIAFGDQRLTPTKVRVTQQAVARSANSGLGELPAG